MAHLWTCGPGSRKLSVGPGSTRGSSDRAAGSGLMVAQLVLGTLFLRCCHCWSWVGPPHPVSCSSLYFCTLQVLGDSSTTLLTHLWATMSSAQHCLEPACSQSTTSECGWAPSSKEHRALLLSGGKAQTEAAEKLTCIPVHKRQHSGLQV